MKAEHHKEKAVGGQAVVKCMSQLDEEVAQLYVLTLLFVFVFYKKKQKIPKLIKDKLVLYLTKGSKSGLFCPLWIAA